MSNPHTAEESGASGIVVFNQKAVCDRSEICVVGTGLVYKPRQTVAGADVEGSREGLFALVEP